MAIKLDPTLAQAHINLGHVYLANGMKEKASEKYIDAINLTNNLDEAHATLAAIILQSGYSERKAIQAAYHSHRACFITKFKNKSDVQLLKSSLNDDKVSKTSQK